MKRLSMVIALSFLGTALLAPSAMLAAGRPHVLVISIDGMRADYVTRADEHHLKIPTLRSFLTNGTYADGVNGVVPSLTYPSHTTLMTGVWPAEHGIYSNNLFDPLGIMHGAVYTQASSIKVETLWQAAHDAKYSTASVGFPVVTGAPWIDYLMPANAAFEKRDAEGVFVKPSDPDLHYDHPAGLRETLAADVPKDAGKSIDGTRFAWTLAILRRYRPEFMTTHLGQLDHAQHISGPFSEESNRAIEALDDEVAQLVKLERSIDPEAYIVIVSDHGFEPVEKKINLGVLFAKAGLLGQSHSNGQPTWDAALWDSGGTAAVMLRDPSNQAVRATVWALLEEAAKNPEYGIAHLLTHDELVQRGGFPDAVFLVDFRPGFCSGAAQKGDVITLAPHTGTHGYLPGKPDMYSSLLMSGPDVAQGRDLGVIDMRQIAPTLARVLGVQLPEAKQPPIHYEK